MSQFTLNLKLTNNPTLHIGPSSKQPFCFKSNNKTTPSLAEMRGGREPKTMWVKQSNCWQDDSLQQPQLYTENSNYRITSQQIRAQHQTPLSQWDAQLLYRRVICRFSFYCCKSPRIQVKKKEKTQFTFLILPHTYTHKKAKKAWGCWQIEIVFALNQRKTGKESLNFGLS